MADIDNAALSPLDNLPPEVRIAIFTTALQSENVTITFTAPREGQPQGPASPPRGALALSQTSRKTRNEVLPLLCQHATFHLSPTLRNASALASAIPWVRSIHHLLLTVPQCIVLMDTSTYGGSRMTTMLPFAGLTDLAVAMRYDRCWPDQAPGSMSCPVASFLDGLDLAGRMVLKDVLYRRHRFESRIVLTFSRGGAMLTTGFGSAQHGKSKLVCEARISYRAVAVLEASYAPVEAWERALRGEIRRFMPG